MARARNSETAIDPVAVALVLVAAVVHATWNRVLHAEDDRVAAMAVAGLIVGVMLLPAVIISPPWRALPFVAASATAMRVKGLSPRSPAAKAGLKEDEPIESLDLGDGTTDNPIKIVVRRKDSTATITYFPRGEPVEGFSWTFSDKAPASCGVVPNVARARGDVHSRDSSTKM